MDKDIKSDPKAVKAFKDRWENSITMSRVPPKTLEAFKKLAKDEFVDDYGMCLRDCLNSFFELKQFKILFFNGDFKLVKKDGL